MYKYTVILNFSKTLPAFNVLNKIKLSVSLA